MQTNSESVSSGINPLANLESACFFNSSIFTEASLLATQQHTISVRLSLSTSQQYQNKKHLKNVEPIRHEPPHAHSPNVASGTVARRLRIDVHDDDDNDNA